MTDIVERLRAGFFCREEAADEIERLRFNLNGRDNFIVSKRLWIEFVSSLPPSMRNAVEIVDSDQSFPKSATASKIER